MSVRVCINYCVVLINPDSMNIALINPHSMKSVPLFHNIELFIWKTSILKQTLNTPTISTSRYGISKSNNSRFFLSIFVPKIELVFFTIEWSPITPLYTMVIPKIISFFLK